MYPPNSNRFKQIAYESVNKPKAGRSNIISLLSFEIRQFKSYFCKHCLAFCINVLNLFLNYDRKIVILFFNQFNINLAGNKG